MEVRNILEDMALKKRRIEPWGRFGCTTFSGSPINTGIFSRDVFLLCIRGGKLSGLLAILADGVSIGVHSADTMILPNTESYASAVAVLSSLRICSA